MKKRLQAVSVLVLALMAPSGAYALSSDFSLGAGYRSDKLDWNIAGDTNGSNPNILSELTWDSLKIFELKAVYRTDLSEKNYIRGSFGYGFIYDGKNQDSDYNGDNRTLEFSRSNNDADQGSVWDLSGGLGFKNQVTPEMTLNPIVGFSVHRQNLSIRNGMQTIASGGTPPLGPIAGLDSSYDATWWGPWAGLDARYASGAVALTASAELHLARYYAEADWNLRSDFEHPTSFEHTAWGGGVVLNAGAEYSATERLSFSANAGYQRWKTLHGNDRTFFTDGTVADTQLNEVNWSSYDILLGARYTF